MSSTSGKPAAPMTPEAKLANRRWRYTNSWWIFIPLLSFGLLGWLGFLVAAIRTGRRSYWFATVIYAVATTAFVTMTQFPGVLANLAMIPFLGCWLGPTIHAAILNRDYLRTIAAKGTWYEAPVTLHPNESATDPVLGISSTDYYGRSPQPQRVQQGPVPPVGPATMTLSAGQPPASQANRWPPPAPPSSTQYPHPSQAPPPQPSSPVTVDVNTADATTLTTQLGLDPALADHIITTRRVRGSYHDLNDLVSVTGLQPHQLIRIRDRVTFSSAPADRPSSTGPTGRILDL